MDEIIYELEKMTVGNYLRFRRTISEQLTLSTGSMKRWSEFPSITSRTGGWERSTLWSIFCCFSWQSIRVECPHSGLTTWTFSVQTDRVLDANSNAFKHSFKFKEFAQFQIWFSAAFLNCQSFLILADIVDLYTRIYDTYFVSSSV